MNKFLFSCCFISLAIVFNEACHPQTPKQDWIHFARISGNGLGPGNTDNIMKRAEEQGVLGIELDNDITGRYDSFLDPAQKLDEIKKAAEAAHKIGNHAFIYIAGLECITENADKNEHSMFKDHPDWVQRDIDGKPAVFTGGASFWITKGDEDVWISPYAKEWRKRYMDIVRQIAATGIDGIYIDVAYWMWLYESWENSWASFDDYTVEAFKARTGVDARKDFIPGDFNNPNFLKWVDFRIETITEFFKEIDENIKSVNPNCLTIPEISPSMNDDVVGSGSDAYEIHKYSDVIAHEFYINTNTGAKRNTFDWITYLIGINTLRAFDQDKPTWLLSYSWDREENTDSVDAMKLLSCTQVLAGANFWDAPGHLMAGSNDYPTRKEIFSWIKANENLLYSPRKPINPVGVYFSPLTRNYFAEDFIGSYYGILHLLLNNHIEYQIITPRTLKDFSGSTLILPNVRILNQDDRTGIEHFYDHGNNVIMTGETDYYNSSRKTKKVNDLLKYFTKGSGKFLYLPECPGKKYFEKHDTLIIQSFKNQLQSFLKDYVPGYNIKASYNVSVQQVNSGDKDCIFISNLKGLKGYSKCIPNNEQNLVVDFTSATIPEIYFIPYLGRNQKINFEYKKDKINNDKNVIEFRLPMIKFGGIVIINK